MTSLETANWTSERVTFSLCIAANELWVALSVSLPNPMLIILIVCRSTLLGFADGGAVVCVSCTLAILAASSVRASDLLLTLKWDLLSLSRVLTSFYVLVNIPLLLVFLFFLFVELGIDCTWP